MTTLGQCYCGVSVLYHQVGRCIRAAGHRLHLRCGGSSGGRGDARCHPTQNAYAERFMRTFKEEHFDYTEYTDFDDAYRQIEHWIEVEYTTERIHSSLDYLTPSEFEAAYLSRVNLLISP